MAMLATKQSAVLQKITLKARKQFTGATCKSGNKATTSGADKESLSIIAKKTQIFSVISRSLL